MKLLPEVSKLRSRLIPGIAALGVMVVVLGALAAARTRKSLPAYKGRHRHADLEVLWRQAPDQVKLEGPVIRRGVLPATRAQIVKVFYLAKR
jgi:hypothetical protein